MSFIINTSDFQILQGDFIKISEIQDFIDDSNFIELEQNISFDCNGVEISVNYNLEVGFSTFTERGDYWTPSNSSIDVDSIDVNISEIFIDEYSVELCSDTLDIFKNYILSVI